MTEEANLVLAALRSVRFDDITCCAQSASEILEQGNGKYRIEGQDLDGDDLAVIAAYDGATVIVTLF